MPDKWYLSLMFRSKMGYWMNWKKPKTFNEKLQWLKIHDRNPLYTQLVDKYEVRKYITEKIGSKYLIPILGVWDNVDNIDFNHLPNQFVLKCTHDSGSVIICKDKTNFDFNSAKKKLGSHLSANYYYPFREWPYKKVKPRIIAEKYIAEINHSDLKDYKFQIFNGTFRNCFVCSNRFSPKGLHVTFYDEHWNQLPFTKHYPKEDSHQQKPKFFEKMIKLSEILAKNKPFVRVDFYETNDKLFVGELTFYPGAGFERFSPNIWDLRMGTSLIIKQ
ncbi:glycosyl transferase [Candidatus Saccharibacteria bacterium]|nr:glycosyl transferase [Candidatus Saccharibacteria bacterium]